MHQRPEGIEELGIIEQADDIEGSRRVQATG
jgi:hypothetical protein